MTRACALTDHMMVLSDPIGIKTRLIRLNAMLQTVADNPGRRRRAPAFSSAYGLQ